MTLLRSRCRSVLAGVGLALSSTLPLLPSTAAPVQAAAAVQMWGSTAAPDQVLRAGCRAYRFSYRVNPPTDDWMAEIFLVGPGKVGLAHATVLSESEPARGMRTWRLCRNSISVGRYVMKMRVTYRDDGVDFPGRVRNSSFRLTAR